MPRIVRAEGADVNELVSELGQLLHGGAEMDPGNGGGYDVGDGADSGGSIGLGIESLELAGAALLEEKNDGLPREGVDLGSLDTSGSHGPKQGGKRETTETEAPNTQELTTAHGSLFVEDGKHLPVEDNRKEAPDARENMVLRAH